MEKPTLPKGTRDFGPAQMAKRQFIFDNIKKVFQKYGFQPLETPAMENLSTLTGKYGEEGDQLLFKVLDSGDYYQSIKNKVIGIDLKKVENDLTTVYSTFLTEFFKTINTLELFIPPVYELVAFKDTFFEKEYNRDEYLALKNYIQTEKDLIAKEFQLLKSESLILNELNDRFNKYLSENIHDFKLDYVRYHEITRLISEKGLRYDLTVPFARYVVMNRGEMTFPFKRYQIQPVWRADRPQKGRYREFYQCDADVVGTDSLICEAEIILMIKEVFKALGIRDYTVKTNHRGILSGLAELAGAKENQMSLFVAIDKLDKIGEVKVKEELISRGFDSKSLDIVFEILNYTGTTEEKITYLTSQFANSESGKKGIKDLTESFSLLKDYGVSNDHVEFDIALARGLSYYTGCIFEVKINNVSIGSVSGGGRYDNLTGGFGLPNVSGVGISFGVDRIYDAMEELKLFPESAQTSSKVLICHFDEESKRYGLKVLQTLRDHNVASEIYPDSVKINKQLDYANKKSIPFTIVIGSDEVKSGLLSFKDMRVGEQNKLSIGDIVKTLSVN
jgi:histidyl-tRNA synthetase